jgi:hypothetical protein
MSVPSRTFRVMDNEELIAQVRELAKRVADLESRLENARVIKPGTASRNYPPDDYELYLPQRG